MVQWLPSLLTTTVLGHGTITSPAMRANPNVVLGHCPWCAGDEKHCDDVAVLDDLDCRPPTPCWGAPGPETVSADKFDWLAKLMHPDGTYWIDQSGGSAERPLWCPGDVVPTKYYVHQDHNGVWFWESQLAAPGEEVEESFTRITDHTSVNNYVKDGVQLANYFAVGGGDSYEIPAGSCRYGGDWSWQSDSCMNEMFAATTLTLPLDLPPGDTVLRWRWFGAMDLEGKFVADSRAERSEFVSCKDVIIGTPEQCASRTSPLSV